MWDLRTLEEAVEAMCKDVPMWDLSRRDSHLPYFVWALLYSEGHHRQCRRSGSRAGGFSHRGDMARAARGAHRKHALEVRGPGRYGEKRCVARFSAAAANSETRKERHYANTSDRERVRLTIFAIETHGRLDAQAQSLLHALAEHVVSRTGRTGSSTTKGHVLTRLLWLSLTRRRLPGPAQPPRRISTLPHEGPRQERKKKTLFLKDVPHDVKELAYNDVHRWYQQGRTEGCLGRAKGRGTKA